MYNTNNLYFEILISLYKRERMKFNNEYFSTSSMKVKYNGRPLYPEKQ